MHIVENDVDGFASRDIALDGIEEANEFEVAARRSTGKWRPVSRLE
jgi:hypothetical protein